MVVILLPDKRTGQGLVIDITDFSEYEYVISCCFFFLLSYEYNRPAQCLSVKYKYKYKLKLEKFPDLNQKIIWKKTQQFWD